MKWKYNSYFTGSILAATNVWPPWLPCCLLLLLCYCKWTPNYYYWRFDCKGAAAWLIYFWLLLELPRYYHWLDWLLLLKIMLIGYSFLIYQWWNKFYIRSIQYGTVQESHKANTWIHGVEEARRRKEWVSVERKPNVDGESGEIKRFHPRIKVLHEICRYQKKLRPFSEITAICKVLFCVHVHNFLYLIT